MFTTIGAKLLNLLPVTARYELFYSMSRLLKVPGCLVNGSRGNFLGATSDRVIMKAYLLEQQWAESVIESIRAALKHGGVFIDVGANIGLVSLPVADLDGVTVIALEPDENNFAYLCANVAMRGKNNVQLLKLAAWHEHANLRFSRNPHNAGDYYIDSKGDFWIEAAPLDSLDVPLGPLVIKIDTQGAEPAVLNGAAKLLERASMVVIEFWPWGVKRMGLDPNDLMSFLLGIEGNFRVVDHGTTTNLVDSAALEEILRAQIEKASESAGIDLIIEKSSSAAEKLSLNVRMALSRPS